MMRGGASAAMRRAGCRANERRKVVLLTSFPKRRASTAHLHDSHAWAIVSRTDRAAIAVRGRDALSFLQNLTTNDTRLLRSPHDTEHTCFLNQKGRSIFEAALTLSSTSKPDEPHLLVETSSEQAPDLLAHLKRSRVRAKVELVDLTTSYAVTSVLHADPFTLAANDAVHRKQREAILDNLRHVVSAATAASSSSPSASQAGQASTPSTASSPVAPQPYCGSAAFVDSRNPLMGIRVIAPSSIDVGLSLEGFKRAPLHHLQALRVLLGIPEGKEVNEVIPLEWNLPYLNAVSFAKGCYLGQELIARGHFRGLIRKRFVPVYFSPGGSPARPLACANPIAATLVRQTDDAMLRRQHGQAPGGHGHGKGHGPSQTHDYPQSQSTGHYVPHSRIHGEMKHAPPAPGNFSPANATGRIRLPFPFVDLEWRGRVEVGSSLAAVEAVKVKGGEGGGEAAGSAGGGAAGDRGAGKVVAWVPGTNVGLVNLRLDNISHVFPSSSSSKAPHKATRNGAPVVGEEPSPATNEATKGASSSNESDEEDIKAAESALRYGDDDCSEEGVARELLELEERCKAKPVSFKVAAAVEAAKPAGDANVTGKGHHMASSSSGERYHVTPVLPAFWRHIPHAGIEELVVSGKGSA